MRVNVYAEEMTDRVEIVTKRILGVEYTGLRMYMELPCTVPVKQPGHSSKVVCENVSGPFIHNDGDDDSAAITFWGKKDLREVLQKALDMLDEHYKEREQNRKFTIDDI